MFVQNIPNLGYNIIIMTLLNPLYGISGPPDFSVVRLIISDFEFPHFISDPINTPGYWSPYGSSVWHLNVHDSLDLTSSSILMTWPYHTSAV